MRFDPNNWVSRACARSGRKTPSAAITATNAVAQGRLAADQSIPATVDTLISFVDDFDPNNWWDATTKQFKPNIAGYYNIGLEVWWVSGTTATNQYNIQIRKNGNTFAIFQDPVPTNGAMSQGGSKLVYLNGSTDYVEVYWYSASGSSVLVSNNGSALSHFDACFVRSA